MKNLIGFLLLLIVTNVYAMDVVFNWPLNDPNQAIAGYCIFEQVYGTWVRKLDVGVTNSAVLVSVMPGFHTYAMSCTNQWQSSPLSAPVIQLVPLTPTPPGPIIINLRAEIEQAPSPAGPFENISTLFLPFTNNNTFAFYRVKLQAIP